MAFFPDTGNQNVAGTLTVTGASTLSGGLSAGNNVTGIGTAPTAAAGANAGTGPPAPVVNTNARDLGGSITFGTGTTPAAGAMVTITLATSFTNPPAVVVSPLNTATQALGLYAQATSGSSITVSATTAPAASQGNTTYGFEYLVVGMAA